MSDTLTKAQNAATYARQKAKPSATGYCAKFVADALQHSGFIFTRQAHAYQYHTNGILKNIGFVQISQGSPMKGDICVTNRSSSHTSGHIAIFDGSNWISDFIQRSVDVYSTGGNEKYFYRAKGGNSTSAKKKSVNEIAKEVIAGKWGNGEERKRKLTAAGYNYTEIQNEVNRIMK